MKVCKDCGKKYEDGLDSCPRCGSMRTTEGSVIAEEQNTEAFEPNFEEPVEEVSKPKEKKVKEPRVKEIKAEDKGIIHSEDHSKATKVLSKTKVKEEKRAAKQAEVQQEITSTASSIFTKQFWIGLAAGGVFVGLAEFIILYATEIIKFY